MAPLTIWHRGQFGTADNLAPGQFGTVDNLAPRTIWHRGQFGTGQFGTRTIWHRGQFGTMCKNGQFGTAENLAPWIFLYFPTQRPKGAQTPSKCHISPNCWQNISNTNIYIYSTDTCSPTQRPEGRTDTLQMSHIPQLLAVYIQYKCIFFKIHIPTSRARRAHKHPPTDIYLPIVGRIYPIPMYNVL